NVFGWSRELTKVTIPANVTTLMNGSFRDSKKLAIIDDAAATITEIGDEAFMNDIALPSDEVNGLIANLTTLNNSVFNGCTAVTEVNIPAGVTTLKNLTFANCTNINRVTVNSATAPTGYTVTEGKMQNAEGNTTDPFSAVNANHMTLTFAGAADGGYKSYREGTAQSNAFRRLLTKTLDESATKYDVAGQMHADVVLKRTMVEGWNTVALPFGVKADTGRDRDYTAAGVYKAAFNGTDAEDDKFMIAAYRGIEDKTFMFLKYADYTADALDEFEPLLIRMGSDNLSDNKEYTFVDVDLNYDVEKGKLYRDGNAAEEVPVNRWDAASSSFKPFIGSNYDHNWDWFSKTTADFAFTGTYFTKTTKDNVTGYTYKKEGDYFIQPGDYIIQSNLFYETLGTKEYRLKGYRAWFQKQPNTTGARPAQLMFRVMALDSDTPTEIDSFDAVDNDVKPFDVYSIGGQLLRKQTKSLNGLPNGIYIVNGRKVAVGK
ncbi:MAG: leucine-rich repeat domain-containing protein, partial [Prevotella sp.]|nr:leucine-rich repeat domain-containing protein [Prevotella sp.]